MTASLFDQEVRRVQNVFVTGPEDEVNWKHFDEALLHFQKAKQSVDSPAVIINGIKQIKFAIAQSITSERSKLSGSAIEIVQSTAVAVGEKFEPIADLFLNDLLKLCERAHKVSNTRAQATLVAIVKACHPVRILPRLVERIHSSHKFVRLTIAQSIEHFIKHAATKPYLFEDYLDLLERALKIGLSDADKAVRDTYRSSSSKFVEIFRHRAAAFQKQLDQTVLKYLGWSAPPSPVKQRLNIRELKRQAALQQQQQPTSALPTDAAPIKLYAVPAPPPPKREPKPPVEQPVKTMKRARPEEESVVVAEPPKVVEPRFATIKKLPPSSSAAPSDNPYLRELYESQGRVPLPRFDRPAEDALPPPKSTESTHHANNSFLASLKKEVQHAESTSAQQPSEEANETLRQKTDAFSAMMQFMKRQKEGKDVDEEPFAGRAVPATPLPQGHVSSLVSGTSIKPAPQPRFTDVPATVARAPTRTIKETTSLRPLKKEEGVAPSKLPVLQPKVEPKTEQPDWSERQVLEAIKSTDRKLEWSTRYNAYKELERIVKTHGAHINHALLSKLHATFVAGMEETHFKVLSAALEALIALFEVGEEAIVDDLVSDTILKIGKIQSDPTMKSKQVVMEKAKHWWQYTLMSSTVTKRALWEAVTKALAGKDGSNPKIKLHLLLSLADIVEREPTVVQDVSNVKQVLARLAPSVITDTDPGSQKALETIFVGAATHHHDVFQHIAGNVKPGVGRILRQWAEQHGVSAAPAAVEQEAALPQTSPSAMSSQLASRKAHPSVISSARPSSHLPRPSSKGLQEKEEPQESKTEAVPMAEEENAPTPKRPSPPPSTPISAALAREEPPPSGFMRKMWHTLVKEPNQLNSPDLADYREMMVAQTPIKPRQHPLATFTVPSQAESVQEEETNEEEKKDLKMEASSDFVDVADDAASVDFSGEGFETCYGEPPGSLGTEEEEAKDMSDAKAQRDADEEQNERKEEEEVISESAVTMDKAHQEEEIKQEMERIDFSAKSLAKEDMDRLEQAVRDLETLSSEEKKDVAQLALQGCGAESVEGRVKVHHLITNLTSPARRDMLQEMHQLLAQQLAAQQGRQEEAMVPWEKIVSLKMMALSI